MVSASDLDNLLPGWDLDLIRRVPINGITHYEVKLIRRSDGTTVFDIGQNIASALQSTIVLAGKIKI